VAYFRNNAVNLLNLHYGIHSIALSGGGAFFIAYLLQAGVPAPGVLGTLALILAGRFVIRPIVVLLAPRFGMRPLVIAGTVLSAVQYPFLATVHGIGPALLLLCFLSALGDTIYWSTYHAYFAALGDHEHRGHQIGAREAISAVVGIASPLVTGWMLVAFGPIVAFGTAAFVLLISALPLLWTPNIAVARAAPGAFKAAIPGMLLFMTDGWISAGFYFTWQIALFLSLGESFLAYGGALAASAFVGALCGLVLGRHIDRGHGPRAVWLALGLMAVIILLRALAVDRAAFGVVANALGSLGICLYVPTQMTALYNQSKRAPCPLRFQVAAEGGWDIGGASGSLLAALLIGFGAPLSVGILLSLLGVAGAFVLLRRYYAQHRDEAERPFSDLIADIGPIEREAEALVRRPRQSLS
jgi:MFS transporter, DHA1 family, inner membrane transport protein